jgi:hypothetical protein
MTTYTDKQGVAQAERRRPRIKYERNVPAIGLKSAVEDLIAKAPRTVDEIARLLGYSVPPIRIRLDDLEAEERIHRQKHRAKAVLFYTWHIGPAPKVEAAPQDTAALTTEPEDTAPCAIPRQETVKTYPAIDRRDPLVSALFGSPEAA